MNLKPYIRNRIANAIKCTRKVEAYEEAALHEEALNALLNTDMMNARYYVNLQNLWEKHGGRSIGAEHHGSLEEAISKAERIFRKANKRSEITAVYCVRVKIGEIDYNIPKTFWEDLKSKGSY